MSEFQRLEKTMEEETKTFNQLVKDISRCQETRQKLVEQQSECQLVKSEIDLLEGDSVVYKLTGPILVEQSVEESKCNVGKRLDMITKSLAEWEERQKAKEKELESQRGKMKKLEDIYLKAIQSMQKQQ